MSLWYECYILLALPLGIASFVAGFTLGKRKNFSAPNYPPMFDGVLTGVLFAGGSFGALYLLAQVLF